MKAFLRITTLFLFTLTIITGCNDDDDATPSTNGLVAAAGEDRTIKVNEPLNLDGHGSYDKSGNTFTYSWSVKMKPVGSVIKFTSPSAVRTSFTANTRGIYVVELRISQGEWTASDDVVITVTDGLSTPATVVLDEDIDEPTTLANIIDDAGQPDYIVSTDLKVYADLIIEPGVVIAFQLHTSLQLMQGSIKAKGTAENRIVMRGVSEEVGYWRGVVIHTNNEVNELDYVTVKHGGSGIFAGTYTQANVTVAGSDVSGGALRISNSSFSESEKYGLYIQGASVLNHFTNNAFTNNVSSAAFIPAGMLHKLEPATTILNNGENAIETDGSISHATNVVWPNIANAYYKVMSHIYIRSGVIVQSGATFRVNSDITINVSDEGFLRAEGTAGSRITFTSMDNNTFWNGIFVNSTSDQNRFSQCDISYAGKNKIADAQHAANIVVGPSGILNIKNSSISNSLGYGVLTVVLENVNQDIAKVNTFSNVPSGFVFPTILNYPDRPEVKGMWLDSYSFHEGATAIASNFYDKQDGIWFGGASRPWDMEPVGFGIQFGEDGSFTWTIAEHAPMTGCGAWSAEYITGAATINSTSIVFDQDFWRSRFVNPCDGTQNVDLGVDPQSIILAYEINRLYDVFTGEGYWELKFTNADNSSFSFYRR